MRYQITQFENGKFGVVDSEEFITIIFGDGAEEVRPYCVAFGMTKEAALELVTRRNFLTAKNGE